MKDPYFTQYEDEIELIDIFRVLWKWKMLIGSGILLFGAVAFGLCANQAKIYRVCMTVQPGSIYSTEEGKRVFIDSIDTIVGQIGAGVYDDKIIDKVIDKPEEEKPEHLDIKVANPDKSDVLLLNYETADVNEGKQILNALFELLLLHEKGLVQNIVDTLDRRISLSNIELEKRKQIEQSYITNVKNIEKRIEELESDIVKMNKNSEYLSAERKKLLDRNTDADGALSVLLYSNTIQQNIQFVNSVKKDMNDHKLIKERELQKVIAEKNEQKKIIEEIYKTEKFRGNIVPMNLLKAPTVERSPVKPRVFFTVLLSLMAGFFVMIFVSFLVEYIQNNKNVFKANLND